MRRMAFDADSKWLAKWIFVLLALSALPYVVAWLAAPPGMTFGGILYNPLDGNSYLAKMLQGWRGEWLFRLPFTEETQSGSFIFTLYIGLGHIARWLGLSLPLVFHIARVLASAFMLVTLWLLLGRFFPERDARRRGFLILALGAGFGWMFLTAEPLLPDLWIPEAFTTYSMLSNPHFPLATGLMAWIAYEALASHNSPAALAGLAGAGLALAAVQPFAIPVTIAVLAVFAFVRRLQGQNWASAALVAGAVAVGAAPLLIYDWWVYGHNPALAAWSQQNVTASPPFWHWLLAYGILTLLLVFGLRAAIKHRPSALDFAVVWLAVAAVGMYVPFALQRRFSTALQVPVVVLAFAGFLALAERMRPARQRLAFGAMLGVASISSVALLFLGTFGALGGEPRLYLYQDEAAALQWLREETGGSGVVLASPELGNFIPAWAGNPVVYGHPFETIHADQKEADVKRFFGQAADAERMALLSVHHVSYLLVGPRETAIAVALSPPALGMKPVFQSESVTLWAVGAQP